MKAAVLPGDTQCPDLVDSSIYDTRPVHFLSMGCNSIKWVIKSKRVYSVDSEEVELMDFLRLNHIDDYNNTTGGFDISDQLRGHIDLITGSVTEIGGGPFGIGVSECIWLIYTSCTSN